MWYGTYRNDNIRGLTTNYDMDAQLQTTRMHDQFLKPQHNWEDLNDDP